MGLSGVEQLPQKGVDSQKSRTSCSLLSYTLLQLCGHQHPTRSSALPSILLITPVASFPASDSTQQQQHALLQLAIFFSSKWCNKVKRGSLRDVL
jgi:hypothetical protein